MGKLSDFPLADYINRGFKTLVETGTGSGTGVDFARGFAFDRIWSCEIVAQQAATMINRYNRDSRVNILCMESPRFLDMLFSFGDIKLDERCVFWLDSHYPGGDLGLNDYDHEKDLSKRLPLEGELEVLWKRQRIHDIIVIDDWRIYAKCPMQGGDLETCGLGHITRYDAPDFLSQWRETHIVEKRYVDTGYIVMMPKSL